MCFNLTLYILSTRLRFFLNLEAFWGILPARSPQWGSTQSIKLRSFGVGGVHLPADTCKEESSPDVLLNDHLYAESHQKPKGEQNVSKLF